MGKMCRLCSQINTEGSSPPRGQKKEPHRTTSPLSALQSWAAELRSRFFLFGVLDRRLTCRYRGLKILSLYVTVTEQFRSNTAQLRIKNEQEFGPFTCPQLTKAELVQVATKPCFTVEQSCVNKYMAGFPERQLPMHTCPQLVSTSALTVEDLGSD